LDKHCEAAAAILAEFVDETTVLSISIGSVDEDELECAKLEPLDVKEFGVDAAVDDSLFEAEEPALDDAVGVADVVSGRLFDVIQG
jgi:hypothetical protein